MHTTDAGGRLLPRGGRAHVGRLCGRRGLLTKLMSWSPLDPLRGARPAGRPLLPVGGRVGVRGMGGRGDWLADGDWNSLHLVALSSLSDASSVKIVAF